MKKLSLLVLFSFLSVGYAESLKTTYNPFTGKLDYYTAVNSTNFASGSGVTVSCTGGVCTFSSGGGTPAGSDTQIQFNNAGSFGASADLTVHSGNAILNLVDTSNPYSFSTGYGIKMTISGHLGAPTTLYGNYFSLGGAISGDVYGFYSDAINSSVATNYGAHLQGSGSTVHNYGVWTSAPGGGNNYAIWVDSGQVQINSSMTVAGAEGANITYGVTVGSMTGAGLSSCGDATHALSWGSGTFGCQSVTGSGGSASTLAVTTGTATTYSNPAISSPTATVAFDQSQFGVTLPASTTAFISIRPVISTPTANFTLASTSTVVLADASAASLTVTLPTAVGIAGKVFTIKRTSSGANTVTIATTSSQTIDGASTVVITAQWTSIDVISDNANWLIL